MNSQKLGLDKRFYEIILKCQELRINNSIDYPEKCKKLIDRYSKEIKEKNLIEKCINGNFAKQLCIMNELKYK